jgi:transitional endoplasmic reticulum ATPase
MLPSDILQYQHTYCMIATSNRSEDIDSNFRRGGRLEYELHVLNRPEDRRLLLISYLQYFYDSLPSKPSQDIPLYLQYMSKEMIDTIASEIAEKTGGYVAADIANLIRELSDPLQSLLFSPANCVEDEIINRLKEQILALFASTMQTILPSCLRGIFIAVPKLTFQDIIGYEEIKTIIIRSFSFLQPEKKEILAKFRMTSSLGGILLHGPPGNSKTRFVKAIASMYGLPLITLTSADVYSAYVGDAEAEIRKAFTIARQASPCILFFDELDSLVINRATASLSSNASSVEARVLATFLNEMDGVTANANVSSGVIVMGATNRIDCIDAALIRKVGDS